jgi:formate hydrogenlyase subunit 6/NADH:ubiquinone oxidoreductase subunit I
VLCGFCELVCPDFALWTEQDPEAATGPAADLPAAEGQAAAGRAADVPAPAGTSGAGE